MVQQQIEQDVKSALLAGDSQRVSVLRSLKSALTYAAVAQKTKAENLSEDQVLDVLAKEAKKRQESADSFIKADRQDRADAELAEKAIIEAYLPAILSEAELITLVDQAIAKLDEVSPRAIGAVIASVRQEATGRIDGALLARITKERLAG